MGGSMYPQLMDDFWTLTFPFIVRQMLLLPQLKKTLPDDQLPFLKQGVRRTLELQRSLVTSLMANMFLCTFDKLLLNCWQTNALNLASFKRLLSRNESDPQEIAKLAMFIHYFKRLAQAEQQQERLKGKIVID